MVFMLMLLFAVLGVALIVRWSYDTGQTKTYGKLLQAFYIARSGADALGTYIETNPDKLDNDALKSLVYKLAPASGAVTTSNAVTLGNGSYVLKISRSTSDSKLISIVSTATVDDVHQTVTLVLQENKNTELDSGGSLTYTYFWTFNRWHLRKLAP